MKNILIISVLITISQACSFLIQKMEIQKQIILIQSECHLKQIKEVETDRIIDITHISEEQVVIDASQISELNDYEFLFKNKQHENQQIKIKIIQNTDQLKLIQEQIHKEGVEKEYQIVVDKLKSDIFWGIVKGFLMLLL
ncbi:unnamed protein product [Paramecium sonneborni]|uniref:Lipoprotein n=1 Tax=Paramecium sonneborni TaxID=65129 RepID=A0A8S1QCF5_9CILI|nr:unnamed protein product [Paramecium sonneborni]